MERLKINQEQVPHLQKRQSTNHSSSNGQSTPRAVRWFNNLYKCWSWLLWPFACEDWAQEREAMVFSLHMSNYESGAYRSCTQVGHRQLSQCNHAIPCAKRQTEYNHQRQRDKLCYSWKGEYVAVYYKEGIEEHPIQRGIRWKFNPPAATLRKSMGTVGDKLQESKLYSVGGQISPRGRSFDNDVYCRADIESKTYDSSQFRRLWLRSLGPFLLLGNKNVCLPHLPCAEEFNIFKIDNYLALFLQFWGLFCKISHVCVPRFRYSLKMSYSNTHPEQFCLKNPGRPKTS